MNVTLIEGHQDKDKGNDSTSGINKKKNQR